MYHPARVYLSFWLSDNKPVYLFIFKGTFLLIASIKKILFYGTINQSKSVGGWLIEQQRQHDVLSSNVKYISDLIGRPCFFPSCQQLCVILEPMQELMSRHKTYNLSPRDCLKTCLFQKWQRMVTPPGKVPPTRLAVRTCLFKETGN